MNVATFPSNAKRTSRLFPALAVGLSLLGSAIATQAADVVVNTTSAKQEIDGFGASSAWCGTIPASVMNALYGDLGFSILRLRIEEGINDNWKSGPYSSWAAEMNNAKAASAKGAKVFASPWNPPPSLRLTGGGGAFSTDPSKWASYRDYLNAYVKYMKDNGVSLYAISLQNEPDYSKDWTYWSATQLHDFILNYGATINTKVISGESFNFTKSLYDQILNDSKALANVSILGLHLYGTPVGNFPYPLFESKGRPAGKKLWMTEHFIGDNEAAVNITNTLTIGKEIHDCMVSGNMSAYVYWWITWPNGLAKSTGTIYQRAHAIGQFAKFIRPGYHRVDATATPATNLYVSAYTGDGKVVIVAVNTGSSAVNQKFTVQGGSVAELATYQTASGKNMVAGSAVSVSGGSFTTNIPAQSITTFVGSFQSSLDRSASDERVRIVAQQGSIQITPSNAETNFDISIRDLAGRKLQGWEGRKGAVELPTQLRGAHLVEIEQGGLRIQRKVILL